MRRFTSIARRCSGWLGKGRRLRRRPATARRTFFEPLEERALLSVVPWQAAGNDLAAFYNSSAADPRAIQAATIDFHGLDLSGKDGPLANAGFDLALLHEQYQLAAASRTPVTPANPLLQVVGDQVVVDVAIEDASAAVAGLQALGMQVTGQAGHVVSGILPISAIDDAVNVAGVRFLSPAYAPQLNVGLTTSQGDQAMRSDEARSVLGLTGAGVTVGILSDSFNTSGIGSYATDVATGDLPSGVTILADWPGRTDEGRAMAQIIHDVAPGASLAFATVNGGEAAFAQHINDLANVAHANVIVDDIGVLTDPFFQDGVIAQAIDDVVSHGVAYFSAAGNQGRESYESDWRSGPLVAAGAITGGFDGGTTFDFDPGAGVDNMQSVTLGYGQTIKLSLQWDSPFFSVSGGSGSPNDLDVYVLNAAGNQVVASHTDRNTGKDAVEVFSFTNTSGATATFNLMITSYAGAVPGHLKYVNFGANSGATMNNLEYATNSGTIVGHANAAGAEAVGAAYYQKTPAYGVSPAVKEPFSSVGTTAVLFDTAGNRLASPDKRAQKPGIVAPDRGNTTFFGYQDIEGDGYLNFSGTSAAAPHAAAVAALMLEAGPGITPSGIYAAMEGTALDMDAPGFDVNTGHGLLNAYNATLATRDIMSPEASLEAANVTTTGDTSYTFTVTFTDDMAVKVSTLDNSDIRVTGPNGFNQLATFVSVDDNTDGTARVATYRVTAPGGSWDAGDKGLYEVAIEANQVTDTGDVPVPAGILGTFVAFPGILYVDRDAKGLNSGTSWSNACTDLQTALSAAVNGDEIWVAAGTYKPAAGMDRSKSFTLKTGVALYGGFAGTETSRDQRNWAANLTTLSGDIGIPISTADNSYHVVYASGVTDATLDGFTITGGNASGGVGATSGGGMYNVAGSSPTVEHCIFAGNSARYAGAGMFNDNSSPRVLKSEFRENSVAIGGAGGGMYNYYSTPLLDCVTFTGNTAIGFEGGGVFNYASSPTLRNVVLSENVAVYGGGVYNYSSSPKLVNVTLSVNTATGSGGGIASASGSTPTFINSILWGNMAGSGPEIYDDAGSSTTAIYSLVRGGWSGTGLLSSDPMLTSDLHLQAGSPAIDAGMNMIGAGAPAPRFDQAGQARPQDGNSDGIATVDIGAYEYPGLPVVTRLTVSDTLLTNADIGFGRFAVTVAYNEPMNVSPSPALTFAPDVSGVLIPVGGLWSDNKHYVATYSVVDANATVLKIDVTVVGGQDLSGATQRAFARADVFGIDMHFPAVTAISVNDTLLTDADVGSGKFTIVVSYNEAMAASPVPTIGFDASVAGTLIFTGGTWSASAQQYTATYDVFDTNVAIPNIGITVAGATDVAGTVQRSSTAASKFGIDTENPAVARLSVNDTFLTDGDLGIQFVVSVTYSETMDMSSVPAITFTPAVAQTLSPVSGAWTDNRHFKQTYKVLDANIVVPSVGIGVSAAREPDGNVQAPYAGSGNFGIDTKSLIVEAIARVGSAITSADTVEYRVTFSASAYGVDAGDFAATGVNGAAVSGVTGSGMVYTVTVTTGTGSGTLRLDLLDDDSIHDAFLDPLGGPGVGNGNFTAGETYTIDRTPPAVVAFDKLDPDPTAAATLRFALTFSEPVFGVGPASFAIVAPDLGAARVVGVSGSGPTYVVTVDRGPGTGTLQLNLVDDDSIRDLVGNPLGGPGLGSGYVAGPRYTIQAVADTIGLFDPQTSTFYLSLDNASGGAELSFGFGQPSGGWKVLTGDWNGDGATGVGLYDPATSTFYLTDSHVSGYAEHTFGFGAPGKGWIPLVGDWNGDGRAGVGLYDPHSSTFYLSDSLRTGFAEYTFGYGQPDGGWIPLVGDWDGNHRAGVGLYDPYSSLFYLTDTLESGFAQHMFGYGEPNAGWKPLVGDWDGNGATDVGLYAPQASCFYLTTAFVTGYARYTFGYGPAGGGWKPLVGDWNGDGAAGVGLYAPATSTFYLTNTLESGYAEHTIGFGQPGAGWQPLAGSWASDPQPAAAGTPQGELNAAAVDQIDLASVAAGELAPACSAVWQIGERSVGDS